MKIRESDCCILSMLARIYWPEDHKMSLMDIFSNRNMIWCMAPLKVDGQQKAFQQNRVCPQLSICRQSQPLLGHRKRYFTLWAQLHLAASRMLESQMFLSSSSKSLPFRTVRHWDSRIFRTLRKDWEFKKYRFWSIFASFPKMSNLCQGSCHGWPVKHSCHLGSQPIIFHTWEAFQNGQVWRLHLKYPKTFKLLRLRLLTQTISNDQSHLEKGKLDPKQELEEHLPLRLHILFTKTKNFENLLKHPTQCTVQETLQSSKNMLSMHLEVVWLF